MTVITVFCTIEGTEFSLVHNIGKKYGNTHNLSYWAVEDNNVVCIFELAWGKQYINND